MTIVIVNLETQYLPDGSLHMSSPDVPGFHVVNHDRKRSREQFFVETALPVLEQTIGRRALEAKIGERAKVRWQDVLDVNSVVPAELARRSVKMDRPTIPRRLIAEIT
jgi:hypothetical protein